MRKVVLRVILGICIMSVAVFATLLIRELYIDWQSRSFYDDLATNVETRQRELERTDAGDTQPSNQTDQTDDDADPWVPYVNFDGLNQVFPGIVGWIRLDGTPINYPVMQHTNNDYFLARLPDKTPHRNGSIFLDYRNNSDFSDKSNLVYGHETRSGDMFASLKNYRNQEFFNNNPVIYLYTPEKDYEIVLFAGHLAHSIRNHPPLHFETDGEFLTYVEGLKRISVFNSNVEIKPDDKIVNLVTCAYDFDEARLILVGILVEK